MQAVQQHLPVTAGQIYNIGGGPANTTSLLELMESIRKLTGTRLSYHLDETRPGDQQVYITDHAKADESYRLEAADQCRTDSQAVASVLA